MIRKRYYYLLKIQYLGFRYHGWQKQPEVLTVERMMQRTLQYVLQHSNFKLLAAGRTDAKVSVNETFVELFIDNDTIDVEAFLPVLNQNLPPDIRALSINETTADFNIIQHPKEKEYLFLFSFGEKNHPFCAPFMVNILESLDISLMQNAAKCMEGTHDFINFTFKPKPETQTVVTITCCEIVQNTVYTANFFPKESFLLRVKGSGFKRHQIRLMMGALIDLGKGEMDWEYFQQVLEAKEHIKLTHIAPASGLILHSSTLEE
ncbi:tRNA pseudouridine synthase A [Flavimarina sp. Hel_I_48]|uniref:tRNA pseudouridine synthase A n=1 Tax=Flavimarina sp. Hel_I_48 TaxID=1392488 RepID=UPI0004DF6E96|nr:tRNA pseudouridine synthase A [Flavimarina sp. Hel_I_48]